MTRRHGAASRHDHAARVAAGALLLALAACGGGASEPVRVEADALVLTARVAPPALRVGENELSIALADAAGQPVEEAAVDVRVHMHAMGAMPAMGGPVPVEPLGGGRYRASFRLAMGGTWLVEIRARTPAGGALAAEGSLTVGTPGLRLEVSRASATAEAAPPAEDVHAAHAPGAPPAAAPGSGPPGAFRFDETRLRQVGVRSEPARRTEVVETVRAVARVVVDETRLHDVAARIGGFVGEVHADALGERVERGDVLYTIYSPALWAAQEEYLQALRSRAAARGTSAPGRVDHLVRAAERRLRLWDLAPGEIAAVARRGEPQEYLAVRAPVSGYVVEKDVVAGSPVEMGQRVYRIAPLDRVWIEAELYESELPLVSVGQAASVTLPYLPGRRFEARVAYVYPTLDAERRTARVRLELDNPDLALRPAMYADVVLRTAGEARLTVPVSAVLHAGARDFAFVDQGGGRFEPRAVEVGRTADGRIEILAGLAEGEPVVVSGTFLVASESRLRAALGAW